MKLFVKILAGFVCLLVLMVVFRNTLITFALKQGVRAVTGLTLSVDSLKMGLSPQVIDIKGLKVYNPKAFPDKVMLEVPEVYVDYVLTDIIRGYIHVRDVRFHLKEFTVVKNEQGALNLDAITALNKGKEGEAQKPTDKPKEKAAKSDMLIEHLALRVDKVYYKEYLPNQSTPIVKEYPVNIKVEYSNIKNPEDMVKLILVQALANTSISKLTSFDIKGLTGDLTNLGFSTVDATVDAAGDVLKGTANEAKGLLKGILNSVK